MAAAWWKKLRKRQDWSWNDEQGKETMHKSRTHGDQPSPIVLPTTGEYSGNDGSWSTFDLRIGTPAQVVKVLASTSSSETVVVADSVCSGGQNGTEDQCSISRGLLFNTTTSSSWKPWPNGTDFTLGGDRGLPTLGHGSYGTDNLTIARPSGPGRVDIPNFIVATTTSSDFQLGTFGLSPRQLAPDRRRDGFVSNLVDMKTNGYIPSLSYGYTAGARYRREGPSARQAPASLILGGYDKAAFEPNAVDFKMGGLDIGRDLSLRVRKITVGTNMTAPVDLNTEPFSAVVDSGVAPYWLPADACAQIANSFNLQYDAESGSYVVDENQARNVRATNPTLSFTVSSDRDVSGPEVTIEIPLQGFLLRKQNDDDSQQPRRQRYVPIKPALNPLQYTLGRAFLQEAYLIANYEYRNFTIAKRAFISDRADIVTIADPHATMNHSSKLTAKTKGLIAFGITSGALLFCALLFFFLHRRKQRKTRAQHTDEPKELDAAAVVREIGPGGEVVEMDNGVSRVEALDRDVKCAYDKDATVITESGPFELPADEPQQLPPYSIASSTSSTAVSSPVEGRGHLPGPLDVSPVEGTVGSWDHTVSPIEGSEAFHSGQTVQRKASERTLPTIKEK